MDFVEAMDYYHTAYIVAARWTEFFQDNFGTYIDIAKNAY